MSAKKIDLLSDNGEGNRWCFRNQTDNPGAIIKRGKQVTITAFRANRPPVFGTEGKIVSASPTSRVFLGGSL